jgi:hypothetical protein
MYTIIPFASALASVLVIAGAAAPSAAKPGNAQIVHIAYTAGLLDIEGGESGARREQERGRAQLVSGIWAVTNMALRRISAFSAEQSLYATTTFFCCD